MDENVLLNEISEAPLIRTEIPGKNSKRILAEQNSQETRTVVYPKSFPIAVRRASGSLIEDVDGNVLIDWMTGISVLNLGYADFIRDTVKKQLDLTWHSLEVPTEARIDFLNALRNSFPASMRSYKTVFGISGSDACETAINMAHTIRGKRAPTIAFEGAYHGISGAIISSTSGNRYKKSFFGNGFEVIRVPYPYSVWQDLNTDMIFNQLERIVNDPEAGYDRPDSVIVEPIQGEGGYIVPPQGFLKGLRKFCDDYDLTLIVDEVQSGMGRSGKMWAFEWDGIEPDILCASKSIGGGLPLSVVYYREDYDEKLPTPFHMGTFRANPLAMAAGTEVLKRIPSYLERVVKDGEKLRKEFSAIGSDLIKDVRGKGFMIGVELEENKVPMNSDRMTKIKHKLLSKGLIMHTCGHYSNVFRYMGALNIPELLNDKGVEIFREVLESE